MQFVAALLATFVLLLFLVGRPAPIVVWDEGRVIVSAMEMRHAGPGLITTYDYHQDLWNTKPPLLVWLMTGSMALFGPTEFAVRLPSLLASMGTILLVMQFLRRITGSVAIAAFGGVALAASVGFFGEHGARTGDYDALLCFCTTSYLMLLFFALHRSRPPWWWLPLASLAGVGALMTKGVAGGIPVPGLLLYALVIGRWPRLLHYRYIAAALLVMAPVGLFLGAREALAPGYWHAMMYNDAGGMFSETHGTHGGSVWYYLDHTFIRGLFSLGPLPLMTPLALPITRGRTRLALIFSLSVAVGQFVVVTASSTKLVHYYLSAYPFAAIAAALAVHGVLLRLRRLAALGILSPYTLPLARLAPTLLLAFGIMQAMAVRDTVLVAREHYPGARYGVLLDALAGQQAPVLIIERGRWTTSDPHYAPELRFYAMVAREQGRQVEQTGTLSRIASIPAGTIVGTCDPELVAVLQAHGRSLLEQDGCRAVTVRAQRYSPGRLHE